MSTNAEPNIIPEVAIPEVKLLPLMLTMSTTQYIQLDAQTPMVELRHFYKLGASDEEILRNYPGLTPADLKLASSYYEQNQTEIDRVIAAQDDDDDEDS